METDALSHLTDFITICFYNTMILFKTFGEDAYELFLNLELDYKTCLMLHALKSGSKSSSQCVSFTQTVIQDHLQRRQKSLQTPTNLQVLNHKDINNINTNVRIVTSSIRPPNKKNPEGELIKRDILGSTKQNKQKKNYLTT